MANVPCLQYTGSYADPANGAYPLGNGYRVYLPWLMRFAAPDNWSPFGPGGIHPYSYCAADPINHSDPDGHIRLSTIAEETFEELQDEEGGVFNRRESTRKIVRSQRRGAAAHGTPPAASPGQAPGQVHAGSFNASPSGSGVREEGAGLAHAGSHEGQAATAFGDPTIAAQMAQPDSSRGESVGFTKRHRRSTTVLSGREHLVTALELAPPGYEDAMQLPPASHSEIALATPDVEPNFPPPPPSYGSEELPPGYDSEITGANSHIDHAQPAGAPQSRTSRRHEIQRGIMRRLLRRNADS